MWQLHRGLLDERSDGSDAQPGMDMNQAAIERSYPVRYKMLVYYSSDVVGLEIGHSAQQLGIHRHFVWRG